jgi:LCP family protein required for cell wall assembly
MTRNKILIGVLLIGTMLACNLPVSRVNLQKTPDPAIATLVQSMLTATPPPIPGAFSGSGNNIFIPPGVRNILVLGSDWRPNSGYRTDVIMLVSLNPGKGTVSIISFPRDLYVQIPGVGMDRINTAQARGGFKLMADTFEANFGIRPEHYVMTNFKGFTGIINSLNGIDVNVGQRLSDTCDLPQGSNGYCTVQPGIVHMDGATALWYVRSRHTTSDFDRERRAQEVLYAVTVKLLSLQAVTHAAEFFNNYRSSVETDLSLPDMLPLVQLSSQIIDPSQTHRYTIGAGQVTNYVVPNSGAMVLLPNRSAIMAIIQEAIGTS